MVHKGTQTRTISFVRYDPKVKDNEDNPESVSSPDSRCDVGIGGVPCSRLGDLATTAETFFVPQLDVLHIIQRLAYTRTWLGRYCR